MIRTFRLKIDQQMQQEAVQCPHLEGLVGRNFHQMTESSDLITIVWCQAGEQGGTKHCKV